MKFTSRQEQARELLGSDCTHIMLFGGSRSGKTFLIVRNIVLRSLKAAHSRHAMFRFRFNHAKATLALDTLPKVMELCFPQIKATLDKSDWYLKLPNGSEIWICGLDDKERTEKILGLEFASIFLNECSQISLFGREMAMTRLSQKVLQSEMDGKVEPLKPRMFYDCNPPNKAHWSYKIFIEKRDPETKQPMRDPENYGSMQMNPKDNLENLPDDYISGTLAGLSAARRRRFIDGEFADANPNALFTLEDIEKWRQLDGRAPDMVRMVVAVDPSGSGDTDNADNDEIGIVVAGLGTDGNAYLIEDCTAKAGPATWGKIATDAFDRHAADVVVGEVNYGGAMVKATIQTARPRTNFKSVTATRGKAVRAEPIAALYEQGKVRHIGNFQQLEDELVAFSTYGYTGEGSPNRADALIWALTELFPGVVKGKAEPKPMIRPAIKPSAGAWMGA